MILYKNVDICDLENIIDKGLLSLNKSNNNNWDEDKRVNNSCDVVYLFRSLIVQNSFCQYGAALLEIDIPDNIVKENIIDDNDVNKDKYIEYITEYVNPDMIINIYIPRIFKNYIELSETVANRVSWCDFQANYYTPNYEKVDAPADVLEQFAKTAQITGSSEFNFFRGKTEKRAIIDLYDIRYLF